MKKLTKIFVSAAGLLLMGFALAGSNANAASRLTYGKITNYNLHSLGTIRQLTREQIAETHNLSTKQVENLMKLSLPTHLTAKNFAIDSQNFKMHLSKNSYGIKSVAIPLNKLTGVISNHYLPKKFKYGKPKSPKKVVALTFDDGPSPTLTPKLLKTLQKYHVHATFFEVGSSVSRWPSVSRQVIKDGNVIGNHSWNHPQLTTLSNSGVESQISRTDAAIYKATKTLPEYVRPPYGSINSRVGKVYDRPSVMWSVDSRDWAYLNTQKTINHVLDTTYNGSIILMHDIHPTSVAAVPTIIKTLKKRGYTFVTLPELIQKPLLCGYQYFGRNDFRND